jgi:hypothetical protein
MASWEHPRDVCLALESYEVGIVSMPIVTKSKRLAGTIDVVRSQEISLAFTDLA